MARGRMISKTLGESRKFSSLQTDVARVVYTLIVANADKAGRLEADPIYITRKVCTRLPYSTEDVEEALGELARVGLVILYQSRGVPVLEIVDFDKHNKPHHKEPESEIDPPDGDESSVTHANNQGPSKHGPSTSHAQRQEGVKQADNEVKTSSITGEGNQASSSENRMARAFDTGQPQANPIHRVRNEIAHLAGRTFTQRYAGDMAAWSRWTNDDLRKRWEASDPSGWRNEEHKAREWIFADLLNEKRPMPYSREPDNFKSFEQIMMEVRGEA